MLYCDHNDPPYLFSQSFAFIGHRQISVIFKILQNGTKDSLKKALKNLWTEKEAAAVATSF